MSIESGSYLHTTYIRIIFYGLFDNIFRITQKLFFSHGFNIPVGWGCAPDSALIKGDPERPSGPVFLLISGPNHQREGSLSNQNILASVATFKVGLISLSCVSNNMRISDHINQNGVTGALYRFSSCMN